MKRFVFLLTTIFICTISHAETFYQYWFVENNMPIQTTCETGGDIILPTPPTKYGYDFIGWEKVPIKRIEYLESTGTQWIRLNYYANPNTKIYIDFALSDITQNNKFIIIGGWNPLCFGIHYSNKAFQECSYDNGTTNDLVSSTTTANLNRQRVVLDATQHVESWPGVTFKPQTIRNKTVATLSTTATSTSKFQLFGIGGDKYSKIKLYEFKLWDNGILIYDMIPTLDWNGTPCMLDKVEGKFYYNQGTGQFVAGPVIDE